jgi:hypothetical protein
MQAIGNPEVWGGGGGTEIQSKTEEEAEQIKHRREYEREML